MFVSRITQISKTKFQVTTDEGDVFLLKERDILLYHIREGQEIDPADLLSLVDDLRKECIRRSGNLLQSRDYSESALRDKLISYGFPTSIVRNVIVQLLEAGYLNDARMAQNYIRYHLYQAQDKSLRRIKTDLSGKGISGDIVDRAVDIVCAENESSTSLRSAELDQVRRLLEKKRFDPQEASWEERQKIMAFLYRRGYSQDVIRSAMQEQE